MIRLVVRSAAGVVLVAAALTVLACSGETVLLVHVETAAPLSSPVEELVLRLTHQGNTRTATYLPPVGAAEITLPTSLAITLRGLERNAPVDLLVTARGAGAELASGTETSDRPRIGRVNEVTVILSPSADCGDGILDGAEACEGTDLGGADCTTLGMGFTGGNLLCRGDYTFDISECTGSPACGNGAIDAPEACDMTDLGGADCVNIGQGFVAGTLGCGSDCTYDTSACVPPANCGNGTIEPALGENCEGSDLGSATCTTISAGFDGGMLACTGGCVFDTAACTLCGDGSAEGTEACDGSDLRMNDCISLGLGFTGGTLACDSSCGFDTSACSVPLTCGNLAIDAGEDCDGTNLGGTTCTDLASFTAGTLVCGAGCQFDLSGCYDCGNGAVEGPEACDGTNVLGQTCLSVGGGTGGALACSTDCTAFDVSMCTACGNGVLEVGESCDGTNLGGASCADFSYVEGTLTCDSSCYFDTTGCALPPTTPAPREPMNDAYLGSIYAAGSLRPDFRWDATAYTGPTSVRYELEYTTAASYAAGLWPVTVDAGPLTAFQPASELTVETALAPVGTRYYWHVRACVTTALGTTCSPFSADWYVNVGRQPNDYNGDGFGDVVVAAPLDDGSCTAPAVDCGRLYLYYGGTGGPDDTYDLVLIGGGGAIAGEGIGASLTFCDHNGDGFGDVFAGANGTSMPGRVHRWQGGTSGAFGDAYSDGSTGGIPGAPDDLYGSAVACLGDVNGDGFEDVAVGANSDDAPGTDAGNVYLLEGSSSGVLLLAANFPGAAADRLGFSVAGGDVNGDGFADLVAGAPPTTGLTGVVKVWHLGPSFDLAADTTLTGWGPADDFGAATSVGDTNGDGFGDVWVGGPRFDNTGAPDAGLYGSYLGSSAGVAASPDVLIYGGEIGAQMGAALTARGDVDGDGIADTIVGEPYSGAADAGTGWFVSWDGASWAISPFPGTTSYALFGHSLACTGDLNGDGIDDLVMGARGTAPGNAYLYYGATPWAASVGLTLTESGDSFAYAVE